MAFVESDWSAYVSLTIDSAQVPANMPDGGESGFPIVLVIDNTAGVNWEGDAASIFAKVVTYANDITVKIDVPSTAGMGPFTNRITLDVLSWTT